MEIKKKDKTERKKIKLCSGAFLQIKFHLPSFPPIRPLQIQDNSERLNPNGLGDPNPLGGLVPAVNQTTANEKKFS